MMQINNLQIVKVIDEYIRTKLFERPFDPFTDNNWKVLLLKNGVVTQHIVKEIGKVLIDMQQSVDVKRCESGKEIFFNDTGIEDARKLFFADNKNYLRKIAISIEQRRV